MGLEIKLDLRGWTKLETELDGMAKRVADLSPALDPAASGLDTVLLDSFRTSSSPYGEPWQPLSAKTVARRRRGSSKPLVDTGQLRSATHARRADKRSIVFGTSGAPATYGPTHQFGRGKIPARPFLPIVNGKVSVEGGRVGAWWARTRDAIVGFILRGKVGA